MWVYFDVSWESRVCKKMKKDIKSSNEKQKNLQWIFHEERKQEKNVKR